MKKLTVQEEKFLSAILKGNNQRQAFKAAYPNRCHWKDKTLDEYASRLFNSNKVQARFQELKDKAIQKIENDTIMSAVEVIEEISKIARADISDYLSFHTEEVEDKDGKIIKEIVVTLKDSGKIDTSNISEVSLTKEGNFRFKLYERDKALYKLAELYGLDRLRIAKQELAEAEHEERKRINETRHW